MASLRLKDLSQEKFQSDLAKDPNYAVQNLATFGSEIYQQPPSLRSGTFWRTHKRSNTEEIRKGIRVLLAPAAPFRA